MPPQAAPPQASPLNPGKGAEPEQPAGKTEEAYSKSIGGRIGFTVEGWVYLDPPGPQIAMIWSRRRGEDVYGAVLPNGSLRLRVGAKHVESPAGGFTPRQWHHVAFVYNAGRAQLFLDGDLVLVAGITPPPATKGEGINVGEYWQEELNRFPWRGRIHTLTVYPRRLFPREVVERMKAVKEPLTNDRRLIVSEP
jgi:hypothetical protein